MVGNCPGGEVSGYVNVPMKFTSIGTMMIEGLLVLN